MGNITGAIKDYGLDIESTREYINYTLTQIDHREMLKSTIFTGKSDQEIKMAYP